MIARLSTQQADFQEKLSKLLAWESVSNTDVAQTVDDIISNIRQNGDQALIDYTNKFDGMDVSDISALTVDQSALKKAFDSLAEKEKTALQSAADRVHAYHQKQKQDTWTYTEDNGTLLGQKITPLDRVGLYVPGGKSPPTPSSVLMNAHSQLKSPGVERADYGGSQRLKGVTNPISIGCRPYCRC